MSVYNGFIDYWSVELVLFILDIGNIKYLSGLWTVKGDPVLNHIVDNDADRKVCFRGNSEYKNISRGDPASPIWVVTYTVTDPSASGRIQKVNAIVFLTILSDPALTPWYFLY